MEDPKFMVDIKPEEFNTILIDLKDSVLEIPTGFILNGVEIRIPDDLTDEEYQKFIEQLDLEGPSEIELLEQ